MPDYNKGDFTQQGVDGFVEGGLHLNEKRCLTARISSNEETAGLDNVEINIHDHLNDLDYTITGENLTVGENFIGGLTRITFTENGTFEASHFENIGWDEVTVNVPLPSGNIAITENTAEGSPLNISQYATATVNVPSTSSLHKISLIDGNFQSMNMGQGYAIYLADTFVCAYKNFHLKIDDVEVENLKVFVYNGQVIYGTTLQNSVMLVSPALLGQATLHGLGIMVNDTEPTTHHVEFFYYSDFPQTFQIVENIYPVESLTIHAYFVGMGDSAQGIEQGGIIENRMKNVTAGSYSAPMMQIINPNTTIYGHALEGETTYLTDYIARDIDVSSALGGTIDSTDYSITYSTNNGIKNNLIYYAVLGAQ